MAGAPGPTELGEARLVPATCADLQQIALQRAEEHVRRMERDVDDRLQNWLDAQQSCWRRGRHSSPRRRPTAASSGALSGDPSGRLSGSSRSPSETSLSPSGRGRVVIESSDAVDISSSKSAASGSATPVAPGAKSASGTNTQVAGVDEADIVKNDGRYVYLVVNGALRIVEGLNPRLLSATKLLGHARELFVEGDRAVIYVAEGVGKRRGGGKPCTYGYDCDFGGDGTSTKILIFDITKRTTPKLVRQLALSGSLIASRRIGSAVHTVVSDGDPQGVRYATWPSGLDHCGKSEWAARRRFAELKRDNARKIRAALSFPTLSEHGKSRPLCDNLFTSTIESAPVFTTLVSFDLSDDRTDATTATIQSRPGAAFASADALYLAVPQRRSALQNPWYSFYATLDEASAVHKFRISERPSDVAYVGAGVVPGRVLNQFSMDEHAGYFRIATTIGRLPRPDARSVLSVLRETENGNLVRVGAVENMAPGEDIRSVRFDGDRAYVVTFKKTDPLFVLDLYHPARPKILGELKIPGFSTYMHRIDPNHLLSIGFDAKDQGSFAYFDGIILQLFDVTRPTEPKLLHKEKLGTRGSSSEAASHHLAFNYFGEKGLLAIPITLCDAGPTGESFRTEVAFSGLVVYRVSVQQGFSRLGGVDHGMRGADCRNWWSRSSSVVKRSIFLDDLVYSIATDRLKVQRMDRFGFDLADISLMP